MRKPGVLRVAPAPLYNTFTDVFNFVKKLVQICTDLSRTGNLICEGSEEVVIDGEKISDYDRNGEKTVNGHAVQQH